MHTKHDTQKSRIAEVLDDLRSTTARLTPDHRVDIDALERAVAQRQRAVAGLKALIAEQPDAFTESDLDHVRASHSSGKRALEALLEKRRTGWTVATKLSQDQYVLKTFSQFGTETGTVMEG